MEELQIMERISTNLWQYCTTPYTRTECNLIVLAIALRLEPLTLHTTVQNITANLYKNMRVSVRNLCTEFQSFFKDYLIEYHIAIRLVVLHIFSQF